MLSQLHTHPSAHVPMLPSAHLPICLPGSDPSLCTKLDVLVFSIALNLCLLVHSTPASSPRYSFDLQFAIDWQHVILYFMVSGVSLFSQQDD